MSSCCHTSTCTQVLREKRVLPSAWCHTSGESCPPPSFALWRKRSSEMHDNNAGDIRSLATSVWIRDLQFYRAKPSPIPFHTCSSKTARSTEAVNNWSILRSPGFPRPEFCSRSTSVGRLAESTGGAAKLPRDSALGSTWQRGRGLVC